jgi:cytochrome P450
VHIYSHILLTTKYQIFGLLIAGHDTTSTTVLWGVKYLAEYQPVQTKLRSALRSTFAAAHSSKRVPSSTEIATSQIHYLDACIEEILRLACTGSMTSRTALKDAVVLGHVIPKGTMMMFAGAGGGILEPAFPIDDKLRSEFYHKSGGGKVGNWETATMQDFNPERWLVHDKNSNEKVFDGSAGPHVSFGAGLRGCYGKKMAYLELRMAIVLVLWHFELREVPEEYGGFEGLDQLTHSPVQCYVRLAKAT